MTFEEFIKATYGWTPDQVQEYGEIEVARKAFNAGRDGMYTREQVERAVNDGADMVNSSDEINLVVNAQLTLLDNPQATLNEVIVANYDPAADEEDVDPQNLVEGYDAEQSAVIRTVRGWVS